MRRIVRLAVSVAALAVLAAGQVSPDLYSGLQWRNIGPFRGGRVSAVTGVVGKPGVFYIGLPGGGVWKTTSAGEVWFPIFDAVTDISSIGAIEVAPSDPNVIYVGTGDLVTGGAVNEGNGMYKSIDAGQTWRHIGLDSTHQIDTVLVDPRNPNLVLAAAQGDIHHPSADRGVYRSTDGGQTWQKTLFVDPETGAQDLAWAYDRPGVVLATTDRHASGAGAGQGGVTALYKSTDEGLTWQALSGGGLPNLTGRTAVAVAANTQARRMFLIGGFGLYRSDDAGATWTRSATDARIAGSGYICGVYVDPKNPDVVYTMNTAMYSSTDGGHDFIALKGAPGGDDNHLLWIDSADGDRMLLGSDQGATVSLDGGHTWSSWYNQATVQVYTIGVDNRFPYWVYGIQQDSDAIATRSAGEMGQITPLDWYPVPAWETGFIAPDPSDPNVVYAGSDNGAIARITEPSWQWQYVGPIVGRSGLRKATNAPIVFSPQDPHTIYFGTQFVLVTRDRGNNWQPISPDLGVRETASAVANGSAPVAAAATPAGRGGRGGGGGTITAIAPSPANAGVIWAGTSNGLIHVTQNGGTSWRDVTPPEATGQINLEASHTDPATAYAAVDQHGAGDYAPHLWRTRDYGQSWQPIVTGLPADEPSGSFVRVVREDPAMPGLLYLGTESSVYVSFDAGDHWQSLRLNLPNTSYRDMVVHGHDLVVGTYGRSFWVLDDLSPLRQITPRNAAALAAAPAHLFQPGDAIRVRRDLNEDTPFPPEVPHAANPPLGAILYYHLGAKPKSDIKLEVFDSRNNLVRTLSSAPIPPYPQPPQAMPDYWIAPRDPMPTAIGTNRIHWDLRYDPPPALVYNYDRVFGAIPHGTEPTPEGPIAVPGTYTVKLTVDGQTYTQPLVVHNDPRDGETPEHLAMLKAQLDLELKVVQAMRDAWAGYAQSTALRARLASLSAAQMPTDVAQAATALDARLAAVAGAGGGRRGGGGGGGGGRAAAPGAPAAAPPLLTTNQAFATLLQTVAGMADAAPTTPQRKAFDDDCSDLKAGLAAWSALNADITGFNAVLAKNNQPPLSVTPVPRAAECGP